MGSQELKKEVVTDKLPNQVLLSQEKVQAFTTSRNYFASTEEKPQISFFLILRKQTNPAHHLSCDSSQSFVGNQAAKLGTNSLFNHTRSVSS